MLRSPSLLALAGILVFLSACSDKDDAPPLEGERISVLELQRSLEPDDPLLEAQGLQMPPVWQNEFWPQVGGYPNHSMQNLALNGGELKQAWSVDIGEGGDEEIPLITQPIIFDGVIYALDTENDMSAYNLESGKRLWRTDISAKEEDDRVITGGIAAGTGAIYATNGYNEVLAIGPSDGKILWRKTIPAVSRAAPTVFEGRVFVATLDSRLLALSAANGNVLWEYNGVADDAALVGAASPAANQDIVVPAFSSGEVTALRIENGSVAWSDNLASVRGLGGLSTISDIRALPVIDKGIVYAISFNGRLVAIDKRTGTRIWQREISGAQTPWMAGNHMFVLSTDNQLIALGRDSGAIRWVTDLPRFDDDDPLIFVGPVLAGGRLILAGTGGRVIEVSPETGDILREWDTGATVAVPPIVAAGQLFILTNDGKLVAYR
ncbi:MAG: PQQ-binding-like beta-propeller repeat protein [Alphaproteobacteria bacterium]|nr:PQQ-binding-like beta-propeller repeat protein [Alphaproteobacteria bacterium]